MVPNRATKPWKEAARYLPPSGPSLAVALATAAIDVPSPRLCPQAVIRVINPSQVLGPLRRRGLVEGYFGNYRLTTAGVEQCRIIRTTTNAE
jgi:hypothetical protein